MTPPDATPHAAPSGSLPGLLIVELPEARRRLVACHLLQLNPDDRRLRFGRPMNDFALLRYARRIDFARDTVFGAFDPMVDLVGLAHVGFGPGNAELGLSVLPAARRRGVALALLRRSLAHARARGAESFEMAFLPGNLALHALAAGAGMRVLPDAEDPRAVLRLERPGPEDRFREALDAVLGNADLGFRLAAAEAAASATTSA